MTDKSMREVILTEFSDYGVYDLRIDREWEEKGRPSTKLELFMLNPKGNDTGKLRLRFTFAKSMGLDATKMAGIMKSYADNDLRKYSDK